MAQKELRYYEVKGKQYPSVTTITGILSKPELYGWYGKYGNTECAKILKESSKTGSEVHQWIDQNFRTNVYEEPSNKIANAINNFEIFEAHFKPEPILTEQVIYHPCYKYAGTFDGLFAIEGKQILVDWKTSSRIYQEYELQLEAYVRALQYLVKRGKLTIREGDIEMWVVRLDKEKEFDIEKDILRLTPDKERFDAFLSLLKVFNWKHKEK